MKHLSTEEKKITHILGTWPMTLISNYLCFNSISVVRDRGGEEGVLGSRTVDCSEPLSLKRVGST